MAITLVEGKGGMQLTELKYICKVDFTILGAEATELAATDLILGFGGMGITQFRIALNTNWAAIEADTVGVQGFSMHSDGDSVRTTRNKIEVNFGIASNLSDA